MARSVFQADLRDMAGLLLVVILAAAMRFSRADVVEYFHDDAMLATMALELADGLRFPLTGILSSTGIPNPPVSVYALALPFAISSSPAFVIQVIMAWNVLGVALLWFLARRFCGRRIALIASVLYAINPWAVLFSRKIWAQEVHTPIILFGLLLLLYGFHDSRAERPRSRSVALAQCLSLPVLLFAFQFHFAAGPLLVLIPAAVWMGRERIRFRAFIAGLILSLTVVLPYFIGLSETLAVDPARISDALERSAGRGPEVSFASITAIARLASGAGLESWLAPDQAAELSAAYPPMHALSLVLLPALLIGVGAAFRRARQFTIILSLWAFLPSLILIAEWTPVYIHYFIPSIPALAILMGYGGDFLWRRAARWPLLQYALWLTFALILVLQVLQWHAALNFVEEHHISYPGFTTPLAKLLPLQDELARAEDVVILAGGMAWNLHHEVAVWDTLLWDAAACVRTIVPDGYAVFPRKAFAAVIAPGAPSSLATDLYRHENAKDFPTRRGGEEYVLYQWPAAPNWPGAEIVPIEPGVFGNGVRLTGYGLDDEIVFLEWQLPARQVGADFQYSAQLYDADGERVGQLDARFWHGRHWCAGDRLLTWGPIGANAGAVTLKVALYRLGIGKDAGQIENLDLLDAQGNPKGQSVDIAVGHHEA
ncbi:MAG: glycosyltransferase family 39 protein [Chloroflexi bacterium]|nr:glycosyltransferase family 39 protein [Chloroflexota bacterium]